MIIQVRYAGLARNKTGKNLEELDVRPGSTLHDLIAMLGDIYGHNFDNPELYIVVHNQQGYARKEWSGRCLREGDGVLLISNISGG